MIKALVFDCFGVFYPDPVVEYIKNPSIPHNVGESLKVLDEKTARGMITKKEFIAQASLLLHKSSEEIDARFFKRHDTNQKLIDFINNARNKYKIGLLSNIGGDMMDGFFTPQECKELFDVVIFSGNEKFAKPDPEVFNLACERLNIMPSEAIMIDDVEGNCKAAESIGMSSIHYIDFDQFQRDLNGLV